MVGHGDSGSDVVSNDNGMIEKTTVMHHGRLKDVKFE